MEKVIMAVDPGIEYLGVAWSLEDGSIRSTTLVTRGLIGFKKILKLADLLLLLAKRIQPDIIVFEDYGFGGKFFNVVVAEFIGVVKQRFTESLVKDGVVYSFLAPTTVKKLVTNKGRLKGKSPIRTALKELGFVVEGKTVHELDALAVLVAYLKYEKGEVDEQTSRKIRGRTYKEF